MFFKEIMVWKVLPTNKISSYSALGSISRNIRNFLSVGAFIFRAGKVPFWNLRFFFRVGGGGVPFFDLRARKFYFPKCKKNVFYWKNIRNFFRVDFFFFFYFFEFWLKSGPGSPFKMESFVTTSIQSHQ